MKKLKQYIIKQKHCLRPNGKGVATLGIDGCLLHPIVWIKIGQGKEFREIVDRLHHLNFAARYKDESQ